MLRIMLVNDTPQRASLLREALNVAGFTVVTEVSSAMNFHTDIAKIQPDMLIIDTSSPSREVLEQIGMVGRDAPRPIVMFTGDSSSKSIQAAIGAGVSAYVVDDVDPIRIPSILEVAMVRFEQDQELRTRLAEIESRLAERKVIDRAKGLIMEKRGVSEDEAYRLLRKLAMDRKQRMAEIARTIIDMSDLLG